MSSQLDTMLNTLRANQTEVVVAVDLGASNGRLMIGWLDNDLLCTKEVYRFKNEMKFDGTHHVWDIELLFSEIIKGLQLLSALNVASIGVDTWGVDYVLIDDKGNCLDKPYAYRDHRTDEAYARVLSEWDNKKLYELTGLQFIIFNTLYQLKAHVEQNPEVFKKDITFLMLPDYFHYKLCGTKSNEFSELSTSQLLNVKDRELSQEILSYINIDKKIFPPTCMAGDVLGTIRDEICEQTGLRSSTKVIAPCTHDTGSAILACVGDEDSVYISSGTWSLIGIVTKNPIVTDMAYTYNFSNEGGAYKNTLLLKNIMGMWIINQVIEEIAPEKNSVEVVEIASNQEAFITLINPSDDVFFNPESMVNAIKTYAKQSKQRVPSTLGEIARCVYDSIALMYCRVFGQLEDTVQEKFSSINIIGGGSKNVFLNQITADITQKTVLAGPVEPSALGSIMLQMVSLGLIDDVNEGKKIIKKSEEVICYYPQYVENLAGVISRFKDICNISM